MKCYLQKISINIDEQVGYKLPLKQYFLHVLKQKRIRIIIEISLLYTCISNVDISW